MEVVLSTELGLGLLVLVGEIGLEAGTEIDVPAPDAAKGRFGVLVIVCAKLTGFARVLCHKERRNGSIFKFKNS